MKYSIKQILLVTIVSLSLFNCSSDDDSPQLTTPSVSYNTSTINATFFHNGHTNAPTVNWNGNQGTFSLANNVNGLSIDATTGVVSWTKILTPGEHEVQVIASNSAGQTISYFNLKNLLEGLFVGVITNTSYFDVEFLTGGTINIKSGNPPEPSFYGTWTITGNEILANLILVEIPTEHYSLRGTLVQTNTSATYSGTMYFGYNAIPGNETDPFNVVLN